MADFISNYRENSDLRPDVSEYNYFQHVFGLKFGCKSVYNERWLCGGQRFSDSEWNRLLKAGDLVVFGVSLWFCLVLQLDLC